MKIQWADGVDYVSVGDDHRSATVSVGNALLAAVSNTMLVNHNGLSASVYTPPGVALSVAVGVVEWVFDNINVLPTYGMFREHDPDGIEAVGAPVEVG